MATANTVTTLKARENFAKAHAGDIALPDVTQIAFGTGGHDTDGTPIAPDNSQTSLNTEVIKKDINSYSFPDNQTLEIIGDVSDDDIGTGDDISECGLYNNNNELVAIKTFAPKTMSADMRIEVTWQELF